MYRVVASGAMSSGPGHACLNALRCAAYLAQQDPADLRAALQTLVASSDTTEQPDLVCMGSLLQLVQEELDKALAGGARSRRRTKRRRRKGQPAEEQDDEDEAMVSKRRGHGPRHSCMA